MGNSFAALAGLGLVGVLVLIIVGFALGALLLAFSFRIVVGVMPPYLRALGVVVATWLATIVVAVIVAVIVPGGADRFVGAVAMFLVGAWIINAMLRTGTGLAIGYGRACLVQLVYMVAGFLVALLFGLVVAMLFGGMLLGAMH